MENLDSEKSLKNYYSKLVLMNKYGLKGPLAEVCANIIVDFEDIFFKDFDKEKMKHIRNAHSNLGFGVVSSIKKIVFYIGLMDKDSLKYEISTNEAVNKIVEILGECTISNSLGTYKRENGEMLFIKTLIVTKFLENMPLDYEYLKANELKKAFNQSSVITEIFYSGRIEFNNLDKQTENEIIEIMKEYDVPFYIAKDMYNFGI